MPLACFSCFGGGQQEPKAIPFTPVIVEPEKAVLVTANPLDEEQHRRDEACLRELQAALSFAPTDGAEARIAQIAAQVLKHLHAGVARLYGWAPDESEEGGAGGGQLVLLTTDRRRPQPAGGVDTAADLPGTSQRVCPVGVPGAGTCPAPLLQQAVHSKATAVHTIPPKAAAANGASLNGSAANGNHGPGPPNGNGGGLASAPPDCAAEYATSGASAFAALPLTSGERLLGVLWLAWAPPAASAKAATGGAAGAVAAPPAAPLLRQVSACVSMCMAAAVDPDYATWLATSLRRLAAAATLQALVGELCEAVAQHLRRRFLVDAVACAAVVPEPARSTVGFMLDHRPAPGGPAGVARWAAATRQASTSMTCPAGAAAAYAAAQAAAGGAGGGARHSPATGQSLRRSDSFSNSQAGGPGTGTAPRQQPASAAPTQQQRVSSHAAPRTPTSQGGRRTLTLAEQAAMRASGAPGGGGGAAGGASPSPAAGSMAAHVVPSLRAKGFQLSHTLLHRMVSAAEGRGRDGVFGGLAVADCGRHVQDVHQPSRDVCMLMAGGVRGADMTADASDSNMFASERSTGRIAVQSLVVVGVDCGPVGHAAQQQQAAAAAGGAGGGGGGGGKAAAGGGAVLALYVSFPTRLPPLLVQSAHGSCRQLLSVMLARLVRHKAGGELAPEFATLCSGVPGSYAVLPSGPGGHSLGHGHGHHGLSFGHGPMSREVPPGVSALLRDGFGGGGDLGQRRNGTPSVALEPSIGTSGAALATLRQGSSRLVPLMTPPGAGGAGGSIGNLSLGASAQLLAFTDAGCGSARPTGPGQAATRGSAAAPAGAAEGGGGAQRAPATAPSLGRVGGAAVEGSGKQPGTPGTAAKGRPAALATQQEESRFSNSADGDGDGDVTATHDEGDVMLSSDPRVEEEEGEEEQEDVSFADAVPRARGDSEANGGGGDGEGDDGDDAFPGAGGPHAEHLAAVLTVTEADGTSSMRQHMGLLVESLMSTLRTTAEMQDPTVDNPSASSRRSLDLELDDLRLSGVLGDGGSGVVLCGMLGTVPVAVKIIQMPELDQLLLLPAAARALGGGAQPGGGAASPAAAVKPAAGGAAADRRGAGGAADGGGAANGGGGGGDDGRGSPVTTKLAQARRDMLRNAMELAVMRSISHVNITTVYAVYDNVILERLKREGGATAYALRRQGPDDMASDKQGASKPVFVALCMELCDSGSLASKLEERSFPRLLALEEDPAAAAAAAGGGRGGGAGGSSRMRSPRVLDMVGIYLTVLEVACALRYLHARRLLHRDIKSANILLKASPTDPRGWTCKLADFGSALVLDQFQPPDEDAATGEGGAEPSGGRGGGGGGGRWFAIQEQSWGTITHMSPESMDNNSRVDASSDIFALGIVMWEIASGRGYRPYKELAPEQIGSAVRNGLRPAFTPEVPSAYRALAQQCWAAETAVRPSAVQVVAAVKAQLAALQNERRLMRGASASASSSAASRPAV